MMTAKVEGWSREDWIRALRGALKGKQDEEFGELLRLIVVHAPELKEKACEIARGFGLEDELAQDRWEDWAGGFLKPPRYNLGSSRLGQCPSRA
jgi:hypothetical protein